MLKVKISNEDNGIVYVVARVLVCDPHKGEWLVEDEEGNILTLNELMEYAKLWEMEGL